MKRVPVEFHEEESKDINNEVRIDNRFLKFK
jgi:hypothetical protein